MKTVLVSLLVLMSCPAFAAKVKNAKCADVATLNETVTPEYLSVVDGYNKAGKEVAEEVDLGGFVSESKQVSERCAKDHKAKLSAVRDAIQKSPSTSAEASKPSVAKLNPTTARCSDFISLGEEIQPVAVFWVAGHEKAGKLRKGEVTEEFLERPIAELIDDCKSKPTASFYDRAKAWLKRKI